MATDPVKLAADLIRCPSVTPDDAGALALLEERLGEAGFVCTRVNRGCVSNLFCRWRAPVSGPTFGFNGHVDVVPPGDPTVWSADPFGGEIRNGILYGRGACDMKSAVAAFAAAAIDSIGNHRLTGSVVLTITSDEEGNAVDGTAAILDWMDANGERMDFCLVGEPTCVERFGDRIKIGRRGSLTARFTARGVQGHSAYPERARNPVTALAGLVSKLDSEPLDQGTPHFDPSTLAFTAIETGNPASNVIPGCCQAVANIRFNDAHSIDGLRSLLARRADAAAVQAGIRIDVDFDRATDWFLTKPGFLSELVSAAIRAETGVPPELSTSGGTSDARFIKDHCPVVEFGPTGRSMHQTDECVTVDEIHRLKAVYTRILSDALA